MWALAAVFSLPAFLLPIYNPDLFWHLSAGRWILERRAVPRADWLSFTMPGAHWQDFEWLAQAAFELLSRLGGFQALWFLKGALLAGAWLGLDGALRLRQVPAFERACALLLYSTAALMHADIRPELFALALFAWLLAALEALESGRLRSSRGVLASVFALFALWASLHLGFIPGLGLIALYGGVAALRRRREAAFAYAKLLAAAGLGTLANPYGAGPYEVALKHWRAGGELARYIAEWHPMSTTHAAHWVFWSLLALVLAAAASELTLPRRQDAPWAAMIAAAGIAAAALVHGRTAHFFSSPAVFLVCLAAHRRPVWGRRALAVAAAACAGLALWLAPRVWRGGFFDYHFVPRAAAEFIARERAVFEPLRAYNPWGWGGYLGWRLAPWHKVFVDGRYIFHGELAREARAVKSAHEWQAFMEEQALDAALMENLPIVMPTTKVYPDGSRKPFARPYYLYYMPREEWALVYWDAKALLFARRRAVPAAWLKAHEYRYLRPRDDEAFAEALARREIPEAEVERERARHDREARQTSPSGS